MHATQTNITTILSQKNIILIIVVNLMKSKEYLNKTSPETKAISGFYSRFLPFW